MKPKPRERLSLSAVRRSLSRTKLALTMDFSAFRFASFFLIAVFSSCMARSVRCATTTSRSFEAFTNVGRLRTLRRSGSMAKFGLFARNLRSFRDARRCRRSEAESSCHASLLSEMLPTCRRCIHCFRSAFAEPFLFCSRSCNASATSRGGNAFFTTRRRPFRLMPKPSTAGNSRRSVFLTTAASSFSFRSAFASAASASSTPAVSKNWTKAEPRCGFSPLGSLTNFTNRTAPNFRNTSLRSASSASKGTFRTKMLLPSFASKPGARNFFRSPFSSSYSSSGSSSSLSSSSPATFSSSSPSSSAPSASSSSDSKPFMRRTSALVCFASSSSPSSSFSSSSSSSGAFCLFFFFFFFLSFVAAVSAASSAGSSRAACCCSSRCSSAYKLASTAQSTATPRPQTLAPFSSAIARSAAPRSSYCTKAKPRWRGAAPSFDAGFVGKCTSTIAPAFWKTLRMCFSVASKARFLRMTLAAFAL
mmetsp:Transcript_54228/g.156701  ORF Transcript_54228/g.156701 Transcript_54228/m.156701 type:complete len:476 (+) Transcript_54228:279-1706(+)